MENKQRPNAADDQRQGQQQKTPRDPNQSPNEREREDRNNQR